MKLTKQQIEYVQSRLKSIAQAKIEKAVGVLNASDYKPLTDRQKLDLIYADDPKKAKRKPREKITIHTSIVNVYEYPEHDKKAAEHERRAKEYEGRKQIATMTERKRTTKIMDKIMLSQNADAALALVDDYDTE